MRNVYCAIDIGATSGRIIISEDGGNLEETYRFPNAIEEHQGRFFWNTPALYGHICKGLKELAARDDIRVLSIGIDTWGVDVVFMDAEGKALALPRAYRDPYTENRMEEFFGLIPKERIYEKTGIQFLNFNTLYQLYACYKDRYEPFLSARTYLFMPDYFNYLLTGKLTNEYTVLSTSQLLNARTGLIDRELTEAAGGKMSCFPERVCPGETIGLLKKEASGFGYDVPVVAVASHDTASAVATVPRTHNGQPTAYLSSGTWSLMGTVTDKPVINEESARQNFTNEGGIDGTTRLLKNITGMWILEQCRKEWKAEGKQYDHTTIINMAESVQHVPDLFCPDDRRFANPGNMLQEVCNGRNLTDAEIMSCIFHSLAHRYGEVFRMLQKLLPDTIGALYIIGGGARNTLLNRLTEEAVGVPVIIGPTEATAAGNILVQKRKSDKTR